MKTHREFNIEIPEDLMEFTRNCAQEYFQSISIESPEGSVCQFAQILAEITTIREDAGCIGLKIFIEMEATLYNHVAFPALMEVMKTRYPKEYDILNKGIVKIGICDI